MVWRDRVRHGLESFDALSAARRARHGVRTFGGRRDRRAIEAYLVETAEPKLHLGCGTRHFPGWLDTDVSPRDARSVRVDIARPFDLADETFHYVYAEHVIEHVDVASARRMLSEIRRVLRPGGVVRLATPDLDRLVALNGADELDDTQRRYVELLRSWFWPDEPLAVANPVFTLNTCVREWGHRFVYDAATFEGLLADTGFDRIVRCGLQDSEHAELRDRANETRMPAGLVDFETMTYEARRPVVS